MKRKWNVAYLNGKARSLSSSLPGLRHPPNHPCKRKYYSPRCGGGEKICMIDKRALERDLSLQRKALFRPLFKCTSVDGKSTDDPRNLPDVPGVIMLIRGKLKVWDHLAGCPKYRLLNLKKLARLCAERVPVLLHRSLYRALKLTFPAGVGGIVLDGRITPEMGTGSLRQSVWVLSSTYFRPV